MAKQESEVLPKGAPAAQRSIVPANRAEVVRSFEALLMTVPDAPESDGFEIFADLVNAQSWEDLNRDSKLPDAKSQAARELKILSVVKRPSELELGEDEGGLPRWPYYLIVEAVRPSTGELVRFQTSSPGVGVPLIKLQNWGKLPAVVRIDVGETTRRGFNPLNLTVLAVHAD